MPLNSSAKGAHIPEAPEERPSGLYEFEIEDTDGHVLRIGSEPAPEQANRASKSFPPPRMSG